MVQLDDCNIQVKFGDFFIRLPNTKKDKFKTLKASIEPFERSFSLK